MAQGSAQTRTIKNSILKHIRHEDDFYPRIGRDYSVISEMSGEKGEDLSYLISATGFAESGGLDVLSRMSVGEMALIRAVNNLSMSGAECESISVSILAGSECPEEKLRKEMISLTDISKKLRVRIAGGNTVFSGNEEGYSIEITAYGKVREDILKRVSEKPMAGDKVVIIGDAGSFGAAAITEKRRSDMTSRFAESYMDGIIAPYSIGWDNIFVGEIVQKMVEAGAIYLHDVTFGGIYRTLLEVSEYSGLGIEVRHEDIPTKQSTIEVCEFWNLNPYKLLGTGGLVAVFREEDAEKLFENIHDELSGNLAGYSVSLAGELTQLKERLILSERNKTHRSITMYEKDEIYSDI